MIRKSKQVELAREYGLETSFFRFMLLRIGSKIWVFVLRRLW